MLFDERRRREEKEWRDLLLRIHIQPGNLD